MPSRPVITAFESETFPIAKTGYVAPTQPKTDKACRLEELVGEKSGLGFKLVQWDGR